MGLAPLNSRLSGSGRSSHSAFMHPLCVDKGQLKELRSLISSQVCHLPEHLLTLCLGAIIREAVRL